MDVVGMKKEVARLTKENEKLKSKFNVLHENEELEKQIRLLESDIRTIGNFSNITFEIYLRNEYTSSRYGYLGQERGELINKSFIHSEEVQNSFKNHLLSLLDEKILKNKSKIEYNKEQLTKTNYDK